MVSSSYGLPAFAITLKVPSIPCLGPSGLMISDLQEERVTLPCYYYVGLSLCDT